ncbi:MAG: bacterial transcriptional activator domain-containing protein [Oscillospiraceae bacterium]|nr:bacterial transcriptional activator domain-containing protein [Oscillospiraceae bacterium]
MSQFQDNKGFYVQMLGGFAMFWDGREISLKSGDATKAMQILQLLLYNSPERVSSSYIVSHIFAYDDILNPHNNLKALISMLRRQLDAAGMPKSSYIQYRDNGYVWGAELLPLVDAHLFERALKTAEAETLKEKRIESYRQALLLFEGEFLPGLLGSDWAAPLRVYYNELYSNAVRALSELLSEKGDYAALLEIAERSYRLLRTEEWQILKMQCLMHLGRWDEAKQTYMEAVDIMPREYGVAPSEELLQQFRLISSQISGALGTFHDMLDNLSEAEEIGGAYYCAFPGFIDSSRITTRSMQRTGISCFLMLCSLSDTNGKAIQDPARLEAASDKLCSAIQGSLRRNDFFTQYNKSQFLIYLVGTCLENCSIVEKRIENNFRATSVRGVRLSFDVRSALLGDPDFSFDGPPAAWS